jgi:hypothetical protein
MGEKGAARRAAASWTRKGRGRLAAAAALALVACQQPMPPAEMPPPPPPEPASSTPPPPAGATSDQLIIARACAGDIERFCPGVPPRQGLIKECMRAHIPELSAGCFDTVLSAVAAEHPP